MDQEKPRDRFWLFALILFIFLQIGDGLSTYILSIKTSLDGGIEGNPIARYVLETVGVAPGLLMLKGMAGLAGYFVYARIMDKQTTPKAPIRFLKRMFLILILVYIVVNIHNWYLFYEVMTVL